MKLNIPCGFLDLYIHEDEFTLAINKIDRVRTSVLVELMCLTR